MKKILLLLIFFSSFSFSYTKNDPNVVVLDTDWTSISYFCWDNSEKRSALDLYQSESSTSDNSVFFEIYEGWTRNTSYYTSYNLPCSSREHKSITYRICKDSTKKYNVQTGKCDIPFEPSDPLDCKKVDGQYSNLDGTCTDCSNFLSDSTVEGMANCACGAVGSSYNGQSFLGTTTFSENGYKYSQSEVKCADGNKGYVYYGKIPLDNNNSDNNSTSPDNNSTKPSDGNTTTPSDGNGTKDGNSTAPSDGNGTGSGKDYTKYLETIVDQLKNIGEDTDNLGGINNGINGQFPTISSEHNIPTDTSGGNWNTYQESWNNLIDSINAVSTKVDEFQGLVQNGFSSPFIKSSPTTCPYTTSFVFGDVGSIPIDVDLCKLFSPLRSIFYYFFYAFFVFSLLVFHVKMFLRLV